MDAGTVQWLENYTAEIVMDVTASSPEVARRIAATRIMQAARQAHIDVDEVEILSVLEVADA